MSMLDLLGLNRIFRNGAPVNPTRKVLDFRGGVTVEDDPTTGATRITIGDPEASADAALEAANAYTDAAVADLASTAYVDDAIDAIDVGGGGGWVTALDLNLTTDAAKTFVDGANTWHGVTWTGANITSKADVFGVLAATGLRIQPKTSASEWWTAVDTYPRISARLKDLIPGFVLGQTRVRVRMMWSNANADANYEYSGFAIEKLPFVVGKQQHFAAMIGYDSGHAGGSGYDSNQRVIQNSTPMQRHSNVVTNVQGLHTNGLTDAAFYKANLAPADADPNATAIPWDSLKLTAYWMGESGTALPGRWTTAGDADGRVVPNAADSGDLCLTIGAQNGGSASGFTATFKRLVLEYRL